MTRKPSAHIQTSHKPVQTLGASLLQVETGGVIVHVAPYRHPDPHSVALTSRAFTIEQAHVAATGAPRAVLDVDQRSWPAFICLLRDCPGTAADYQMYVLSATPDNDSQRTTLQIADALLAAGAHPSQIKYIRVAEQHEIGDVSYPLVSQFYERHGLDQVRVPAVLRGADVLLKIRAEGMSLGELLHGKTDFLARLDEARRAEADDRLPDGLMHKVLLQRQFNAIREMIAGVIDPLGLPRITAHEWIEEADRFARAAECRFPRACAPGEDSADVSPAAPEAV